jgi:hypothetical protein
VGGGAANGSRAGGAHGQRRAAPGQQALAEARRQHPRARLRRRPAALRHARAGPSRPSPPLARPHPPAPLPPALEVIDFENEGSSGAGWTIGKSGLPKLPLTSVLAVVGVGAVILEAASHAPVLSIFMPRVLSVAGWLAGAGYLLDKRAAASTSS